ncbi:MAG TPA: hypothetical protein VF635_09590 [Propionibacteriaceae bacterium]
MPNSLIRDPKLKPGPARLILWLASQSEHRTVYKKTCADELGVSRTTLNEWLEEAQLSPYLWLIPTNERDHQGNPTHIYHVSLTGVVTADSEPRSEPGRGRVQDLDAKKTTSLEDHGKNIPSSADDGPQNLQDINVPSAGARGDSGEKWADMTWQEQGIAYRFDSDGSSKDQTAASRTAEAQIEPHHLPADWQPNKFHWSSYTRLLRDHPYEMVDMEYETTISMQTLVDYFATQMRHKRLRNWDRSFGAYLNTYAEGRQEFDFPPFPDEDEDEEDWPAIPTVQVNR